MIIAKIAEICTNKAWFPYNRPNLIKFASDRDVGRDYLETAPDPLDRPKRVVLQVKGRRAGLGLDAVCLKGVEDDCKESTVFVYEIFKKSEQLEMYRTYYTAATRAL